MKVFLVVFFAALCVWLVYCNVIYIRRRRSMTKSDRKKEDDAALPDMQVW